jgi:hypothetical protein
MAAKKKASKKSPKSDIVEIDGVKMKKLYDDEGNFMKYTKKLD